MWVDLRTRCWVRKEVVAQMEVESVEGQWKAETLVAVLSEYEVPAVYCLV